MADKPSVLFVCVHNAGRPRMATGLLTHLAGDLRGPATWSIWSHCSSFLPVVGTKVITRRLAVS
jgi:protein-tyrosine-phosphatase